MSGQSHAEFAAFAALSATLSEYRVLVHHIGPKRDPLWDNVWIWLTARQLGRTLAAVLKVHPQIDQSDYLAIMTRVVEGEVRLEQELANRPSS